MIVTTPKTVTELASYLHEHLERLAVGVVVEVYPWQILHDGDNGLASADVIHLSFQMWMPAGSSPQEKLLEDKKLIRPAVEAYLSRVAAKLAGGKEEDWKVTIEPLVGKAELRRT